MAQTAGGTYYAASSELVSSWPATSLNLANQLESRFAAKLAIPPAWTAWTPVLTAATTNPNIGSTGQIDGYYSKQGRIVAWNARITTGGTGIAAGSGQYFLSLPVAPARTTQYTHMGSGFVYAGNPNGFGVLAAFEYDLTRMAVLAAANYWSSTNFQIFSAGQIIEVGGIYESAS